jgi:flagellar biosynthesis/type III secretory pathway protein FliH
MPPLRLEVFETTRDGTDTTVVTDLNAMEEARLASYEQGYTAGWEDAVTAQQGEKARMSADLAHNLQSLNFTYHEARAHVLTGMEPLLLAILAKVLPEVAKTGLPAIIQQAIMPLADQAADMPIKLLFNPMARPILEPLIEAASGPPIVLIEEPTLGEGQVFLQLGESETRIDLDEVLAEITTALTDFLAVAIKDHTHG